MTSLNAFVTLLNDARRCRLVPAVTMVALAGLALAGRAESTNSIWFTGREVFPIDNQISQLRVADFDGDGLNDLIVVNNARSRINILYNQTGKTNLDQQPLHSDSKGDVNELPPDAR